ncbi:MAG: hypothetical protein IJ015_04920 [Ruminococcus sp.]|nr:hypothetical protein [Ruminococcus sp.]
MKYCMREDCTIKKSLSSYEDVLNNTYVVGEDSLYEFDFDNGEFMKLTYERTWWYVYLDNGNVLTTLTEKDLQMFDKTVEQFEADYSIKLLDIEYDDEFYEKECPKNLSVEEFNALLEEMAIYWLELSCERKYK